MKPAVTRRPGRRLLLVTALASLLTGAAAMAADVAYDTVADALTITGGPGTWDATTSNWTTDNGFSNELWVNANNDTAIFGDVAGTVTLAVPITVGGLTFNSAGYVITGGTLSFGADGSIDTSADASIHSVVAGSFLITKTGTGTLTLAAVNTYDGATAVNAGTLKLSDARALQASTLTTGGTGIVFDAAVSGHAFTVGGLSGSSNLALQDDAPTPNAVILSIGANGASTSYSGLLSGSGALTKVGGGTLTLSGANTYTGATTVNGGTLKLDGSGKLGNGSYAGAIVIASGAAINFNNTTHLLSGPISGDGTLTKSGSGTLTLSGSVSIAGGIASTSDLIFNSSSSQTWSAPISGTGGINKQGAGTLTLTGSSTYTGVTSFATGGSAGTLVATTLADGGISGVGTANSLGLSSNAAANLLLGGATTLRYTGPAASTDRRFTLNANTAAQVFTLDASGSGPIQFTNPAAPAFEVSTRTHTLNLSGSNTGDNVLAANVANASTGATTLTKSGRGTWVLTGASHSYTGGTFANFGTLKVAAGSGAVLSSGLTFGGSAGSAGGTFIYDSTGTVSDLSQSMAALATTLSLAADNTLQVTGNGSHNTTLTFSSVTTSNTENGNTINFVVAGSGATNGTNTKIVFAAASGTTTATASNYAAITSQTAYFNGGQFAVYDKTGGFVRGINYATDSKSSEFNGTAITGAGTTTNAKVTGSIAAQGTATLGSSAAGNSGTLLIPGSFNITQTAGTTLTLSGIGNAGTYGILKTGGSSSTPSASTISGGTIAFASGAQTDIRVDSAYDTLTISSALTNTSNVRLMKSGAGTLILSGGNLTLPVFNQFINGGVLEFAGSGAFTFAGTGKTLVIAPAASFRHNSNNTSSSIAQPIVGSGGVSVNAGTLSLSGTNLYSGGTSVTGGALSFLKTAAQPAAGTTTVAAGATLGLGVGGTGGFSSVDVDSLWANTLSKVSMDPAASVGIDTAAADFTYATSQSTRGLTKLGANTLTLTGTHSYAGDTIVKAGSLVLDVAAGLKFTVSDASSNKISGAGSVTLNGSFTIDTSAVTLGSGAWTLVDVATLNATFGATFSMAGAGWSKSANVWTKVVGAQTWTFTEASGVLELSAATPAQIVLKQGLTILASNGAALDYGPLAMGTSADLVFTIENSGTAALNLTGPAPYVVVSGPQAADFTVTASPATTVAAGTPTTFTVRFTPGLVNSHRAATLTLSSNSAGAASFVINLAGSGAPDFNSWKLAYTGDMTSGGDPDHDGLSNFHEYAFGLNPNSSSSLNPINVPLNRLTGTFSYTRRDPSLTGISYAVLTSTSLLAASWLEDAGAVQTPSAVALDGTQTVAVTLSSALLTAPNLFIRVQAFQP